MTKRDLPALSIIELRDFLRRGEISPSETLQALEERIKRRIGRSRRRGYCIRRAWHRHRWIDSSARRTVRNSRVQAQLWPRLALRSRRLCFLPRSDRTANENCTRLRFADERDCRP